VTLHAGDHLTGQDLVLVQGGTISGHVLGGGRGLAGVHVEGWSEEGETRREAVTGADGAYRLAGFPGGTCSVRLSHVPAGFAQPLGDKQVQVRLGETVTDQNFALEVAAAGLSGRVTHNGAPVVGARVTASGRGTAGEYDAETDAEGRYTFTGLATAEYGVSVFPAGDDLAPRYFRVTVGAGEQATAPELALTPGVLITGKVTSPDGRQPVWNVGVRADTPGSESGMWTLKDGTYHVRCAPGHITVIISGGSGEMTVTPKSQEFDAAEGETHAGVDFTVPTGPPPAPPQNP
jgi:hypothetical protein